MACGVSHYQVAIPSYLDGPYLTPLLLSSADVVLEVGSGTVDANRPYDSIAITSENITRDSPLQMVQKI